MNNPDLISAIEPVVKAFEKLGVLYYIGGSVASSAHGIARATLDVDMVSDLRPDQVTSLVKMLESSYYIDEKMILDAIQKRSTFNLIHLETMLKVDVFIMKEGPYHEESLKRRKKDILDGGETNIEVYIVSPEDIIINKLDWYRMGGEVFDTQWRDVLGVMKVQGELLDLAYLKHWASELKLDDLLDKAFHDAGIQHK